MDSVLIIISSLLDHDTGYSDYRNVPLEIAVGSGQYDRWARYDGSKLIAENSTIAFLKANVIQNFRERFRTRYGHSIMSTFVLFTESAHDVLGHSDKEFLG